MNADRACFVSTVASSMVEDAYAYASDCSEDESILREDPGSLSDKRPSEAVAESWVAAWEESTGLTFDALIDLLIEANPDIEEEYSMHWGNRVWEKVAHYWYMSSVGHGTGLWDQGWELPAQWEHGNACLPYQETPDLREIAPELCKPEPRSGYVYSAVDGAGEPIDADSWDIWAEETESGGGWETIMTDRADLFGADYSLRPEWLGERAIDGTWCDVWLLDDGRVIAQVSHALVVAFSCLDW